MGGWVNVEGVSSIGNHSAISMKGMYNYEQMQAEVHHIRVMIEIDKEELLDECMKISTRTGRELIHVLKEIKFLIQNGSKLPWRTK